MSFDNDYPQRKDRRKPYRDSRSFDRSCRHGGDCDYCKKNRTRKRELEELKNEEYFDYLKEEEEKNENEDI